MELQSLTFMSMDFKGLLPINLQTRSYLNIGNKTYKNNFKCQYSRTTKEQQSFIGVKLWNKTDEWILNSKKKNA